MAKNSNQKLKLMYLQKILLEKTDQVNWLSMKEIIAELAAYGISAERKSIYDDIESLKVYGMDIIGEKKGKNFYYHVGNRKFELAELKLLVDSVQSAKFITEKKSNELINKIEGLTSNNEANQLQRQVFVQDRIKTMNESIYYNVDAIHDAINNNKQICFQYFQWNVDKKPELKHGGKYYQVSPWALTFSEENYYLIGLDSHENKVKHFRVDKMKNIRVHEEKRQKEHSLSEFNQASYANKMFAMFAGEETLVNLKCENGMAGIIIDRFGKDIPIIKMDEQHFTVHVKVSVSPQFIHWVLALGNGVQIVGPEEVVNKTKKEIKRLSTQYELA